MDKLSKLLIFSTGTKTGGGSGFEKLVENNRTGILKAEIVGVVSNLSGGRVEEKADRFGVPFYLFSDPYTAENYKKYINETKAGFIALSGWLKFIKGLDPTKTINIHPGPLPDFGGKGMYGHNVHEAVIKACQQDKIKFSAVTMHFVTEDKYDAGPVFFSLPVAIFHSDTPETLAARVNECEHGWQSFITNLVVTGQISWDGKGKVVVPDWYKKMPFCPASCTSCKRKPFMFFF